MTNNEPHDIEELNIRVDEEVKNTLYNIIKQVVSRMYTESMLVVLISRLRSQGKINSPPEIVEYMIREPADFYKQILEQFREQASADAFIKTLFNEISRATTTPLRVDEIIETLHRGDEKKFQEKILEIIHNIRTRTLKPMY